MRRVWAFKEGSGRPRHGGRKVWSDITRAWQVSLGGKLWPRRPTAWRITSRKLPLGLNAEPLPTEVSVEPFLNAWGVGRITFTSGAPHEGTHRRMSVQRITSIASSHTLNHTLCMGHGETCVSLRRYGELPPSPPAPDQSQTEHSTGPM